MSPEAHDDQQRLSGRLRRAAKAWPADAPPGVAERLAARVSAATAGGRTAGRPLAMPAWRWLAVAAGLLIALGALTIAHGAPAATVAPLVVRQPPPIDPFILPLPVLPTETPLSGELRNLDADMRATAEFLVDRLPRIELAQREGGGKGQP
jgi:hypothetical protein